MNPLTLACLLVPLAWSEPAAAPQPAPAAVERPEPGPWLEAAFGPESLAALRRRGIFILQGRPGAWRLRMTDWKALQALSARTQAAQELEPALAKLKAGQALADSGPLAFLPLAELPPSGLVTPPMHALLAAMAAYHDHWTALTRALAEPRATALEAPAGTDLFAASWGKEFAKSTGADAASEAVPLAKPYFDKVLAGVHRDPAAAAHFVTYVSQRWQADVLNRLETDVSAGLPSEELRGWLRRYLGDQLRIHALADIRRRVSELEKKTSLASDLAELRAAAAVLRGNPKLIAELEGLVQAAAPAPGPELTSAGLHLEKPVRLGQHEQGDAVTVSGAYWVDGLPPGQRVEVEETSLRRTPKGFRDVETRAVKRANGGPYVVSRTFVLEDSRSFLLQSIISAAAGNVIDEAIEVPVAKEFELALGRLASADNQALGCALKEAETSYARLEAQIADAAREKPQYRELLETCRARRQRAVKNAAALAKLEEALPEAASDSSPERCQYDLKRVDDAVDMARSLPAGCDRYLSGLRGQRRIISRRAADQRVFCAADAEAASRRRACDFGAAARGWARGLAILDADPAARCGRTAREALRAEADIRAAGLDERWRAAFSEQLQQAESETTPSGRLSRLNPLLARIGALPDPYCFAAERTRAETLAREAGQALVMPDAVEQRLGGDESAGGAAESVAARRRELLDEAAALRTKLEEEQAPAAVAPAEPPAKAAAPAKPKNPVKAPAESKTAPKARKTRAEKRP
ncbi:MAG: hypothetical protein PHF00_01555 [Elusimicrobia bacterium]|nr:hypothetical protein [Elusimicrobiota bacterium]